MWKSPCTQYTDLLLTSFNYENQTDIHYLFTEWIKLVLKRTNE